MVQYQRPATSTTALPAELPRARQLFTELLVASGVGSGPLAEIVDALVDKCVAVEFQLGETLLTGSSEGRGTAAAENLHLLAHGRIRLLSWCPVLGRSITLFALGVGDWFGADAQVLPYDAESYQALGGSAGLLYRLPAAALAEAIDQCPELGRYLGERSAVYRRVAFFRCHSNLCALAGAKVRQVAEQAIDYQISAQTPLSEFGRDKPGLFWLHTGCLEGGSPPLSIGESWAGGDSVTLPWRAATDLLVHHLPAAACVALEIGPNSLPEGRSPLADLPLRAPTDTRSRSPVSFETPPPRAPEADLPPTALARQVPTVIFPKPSYRKVLDRLQRFPWVEQQSSSDCGVACLAMIARYWGKRLPINLLREQANVGRAGASLKGLARAAENIGFQARPVRASLDPIAKHRNPWIAHWQGDHYVVVYAIAPHQVILADPALGRQVISREEFKTHWTGYGLLLEPTERFRSVEVKQASLGRYIGLLQPYRPLIIQILVLSLLIQVFSLVTPLFTQIILDRVVVQRSMSTLNVFAIGLLMFSVWSIILETARSYLLAYFSIRLDLTMVSGFVRHAISLPLKFYESRRVGDILTRVQENQKIQRFLIGQVMLAWLGFLTGFVYLGLMLYYNLQLTLLVLLLIPPIVIITLVSTPFLRRISREVFKEAANQNSNLVEMMSGIAAVKSAAVEQEVRWRWEDSLTQLNNAAFKGQKFGLGLGVVNGAVNTLGSTALLWLGASMVIQEQLTIGQFVAFNMMIGYVLSPVVALAGLWDEMQEIFISIERLNDVFEAEPEETPGQPMLMLPALKGEVVFEGVTFRYADDADQNTLENLSFQVEPGQTLAIVGRSGSGKTTLVKLIEGLYHPNQGRVFVDGHDVRHVSPHSLRSQLGVVPQECFLFSGTILENITLYRQDFTLEQAVEAAKLAEAHGFIQALPLGYNTKVGERGSTLSGGQRQRIAIARALLGNPPILLLDEATSSLDTESERRFQRNLAQISRDRTTIIIAHRLSTVRNADRILVLDKGVLVEQGNHAQLMALEGLYHSLAQQQLDI